MKKLLLLIPLVALLALVPACNSTPTGIAYKAEGVTILTVDAAMNGWRDWVNGGHATAAQVEQVHAAYNRYYDAQQVAKVALEAALGGSTQQTSAALSAAQISAASSQASLISLIQTFTKGAK